MMMRTAALVGALLGAFPALAQDTSGPAEVAIGIAQQCLRLGDAAFEHSLTDGLAEVDRMALVEVFETATFECLGLGMEICEGQGEAEACLGDLTAWVQVRREEIVAGLPDTIETDNAPTVGRYEGDLARARTGADQASCDHMSEDQRDRYCETVSEGVALEDAYGAWRVARREGAAPLVGHAPVDLENLR